MYRLSELLNFEFAWQCGICGHPNSETITKIGGYLFLCRKCHRGVYAETVTELTAKTIKLFANSSEAIVALERIEKKDIENDMRRQYIIRET